MAKVAAALAFLALNFWVYAWLGSREVIPERESFASFPKQLDGWHCDGFQQMDPAVLDTLGATDYLLCDYRNDARNAWINVYVGYHESQVRSYADGEKVSAIHPPEHCLPGAGWSVIESSLVPVRSGGLEGLAKRFVIARGDHRNLVYFWYQSRGRVLSRNHEVILYKFWDRATRGRSDGALVRFTTPIVRGDVAAAEAAIRDFAALVTPRLGPYLPE